MQGMDRGAIIVGLIIAILGGCVALGSIFIRRSYRSARRVYADPAATAKDRFCSATILLLFLTLLVSPLASVLILWGTALLTTRRGGDWLTPGFMLFLGYAGSLLAVAGTYESIPGIPRFHRLLLESVSLSLAWGVGIGVGAWYFGIGVSAIGFGCAVLFYLVAQLYPRTSQGPGKK
jgi:uncharacterized membrane protein YhaH (DUF805 family)